MVRYRLLGSVLVLLAAACQSRETPQQTQARIDQESAAAKPAISAADRNFERFMAEGKADSLASLFTPQGREMPPNQPTAVGRAAIAAAESRSMAAIDARLTMSTETVIANGPMAIETGLYAYEGIPRKGAPKGTPALKDNGRYMLHWHQVGGQWMMADAIWNSSAPMAMPGAKPAAKGKAPAKAPSKATSKSKAAKKK